MKARILSLAFAATSMLPAAQASVLSFDFTVSGAGGTTPSYIETLNANFIESGPRSNIVENRYDEVAIYGNNKYITHYANTTYDVYGFYKDAYIFSGSVSGPEGGTRYAYISGTVTFDPTAATNMAEGPATMDAGMLFSGTYALAYDPEFPSIPVLPPSPQLAFGHGTEKADLVPVTATTSFNAGYFSLVGYDDAISLVPGKNAMQFMFYANPALNPGITTAHIFGPAYDFGTHQRSERLVLGYEVLPVPEPTTWAMLLAGVGILGIARRRKNAA